MDFHYFLDRTFVVGDSELQAAARTIRAQTSASEMGS
jgi:hypothetical protein